MDTLSITLTGSIVAFALVMLLLAAVECYYKQCNRVSTRLDAIAMYSARRVRKNIDPESLIGCKVTWQATTGILGHGGISYVLYGCWSQDAVLCRLPKNVKGVKQFGEIVLINA